MLFRKLSLVIFTIVISVVTSQSTPFQSVILHHHNIHRSNHSAPALTWNIRMQADAQVLARSCLWGHNTTIGGGGYGQNIAAGYPRANIDAAISDGFYNSELPYYKGQYGKPTPDMSVFENFGHFTQLVWVSTESVGCANINCASQGGLRDATTGQVLEGLNWYTVCNYYPAGNYLGEFADNVMRPLGMPTVTV